MVSKTKTLSRFAFTLIELIFAIVIISIAVVSLPVMVQITSKGIENSLVQEAVFAASAEIMGATSYYWDQRSMEDVNVSHMSRVIDIGGTCENNSSLASHRLRDGHIAQAKHRRCLVSTSAAGLNALGGDYPGLNQASYSNKAIFVDPGGVDIGSATGYKHDYQSDLNVTSNATFTGTPNTDMKKITVTISNADSGDTVTSLSTYSANIGEVDYLKRSF